MKLKKKPVFMLLGVIFAIIWGIYLLTILFSSGNTITIKADLINVREGPGLTFPVTNQVKKGEKFKLLNEENDWFEIKLTSNTTGWVASWLVTNTEIGATESIGHITTDNVNVRKSPDDAGDVLGKLSKGDEVTILTEENDWAKISMNGKDGWVNTAHIKFKVKADHTKTIQHNEKRAIALQNDTNVRTKPGTDSSVVRVVHQGDSFIIMEEVDDWYKIKLSDSETGYIANWVVSLSPATVAKKYLQTISEATIVIDPGHGGNDPGSEGSGKDFEKNLTLKTALLLEKKLKKTGANVIITRKDDTYMALSERTEMARNHNADAFISLHYDSVENDVLANGFTTYYFHPSDKEFAETIHDNLAPKIPIYDRGLRFGNYFVLRENVQTSVLLELGYLSNPTEEKMVHSKKYQNSVTTAIKDGLVEYFGK